MGLKISRERLPDPPDSDGQLIANGQRGKFQDGGYFFISKAIFFHQLKDQFALRRELPDHQPDLFDKIRRNTHFHGPVDLDHRLDIDRVQAYDPVLIIFSDIIEREVFSDRIQIYSQVFNFHQLAADLPDLDEYI